MDLEIKDRKKERDEACFKTEFLPVFLLDRCSKRCPALVGSHDWDLEDRFLCWRFSEPIFNQTRCASCRLEFSHGV